MFASFNSNTMGATKGAGTGGTSETHEPPSLYCRVRDVQFFFVFLVDFCVSCLESFFDLRLLITNLVYSNSLSIFYIGVFCLSDMVQRYYFTAKKMIHYSLQKYTFLDITLKITCGSCYFTTITSLQLPNNFNINVG